MSIRESSLSWSGVMVVEVTGRASCLGGAAAVHTSLTCQTGLDNKQWNMSIVITVKYLVVI